MILERLEGVRFSRVIPAWRGRTAVLIGGGPSLTEAQVHEIRLARERDEVRAVAVNDAYLWAPWADVHYAADGKWHRWHTAGIAKPTLGFTADEVRARWAAFTGQKCSIDWGGEWVADERIHVMRNLHGDVRGYGLSTDPERLVTGFNSGFCALNLAFLAGSARIILVGFDGSASPTGASHWHGGHPTGTTPAIYEHVRRSFSMAEAALEAAGVVVVNCSPGSAIESFPKARLADALAVQLEGAA